MSVSSSLESDFVRGSIASFGIPKSRRDRWEIHRAKEDEVELHSSCSILIGTDVIHKAHSNKKVNRVQFVCPTNKLINTCHAASKDSPPEERKIERQGEKRNILSKPCKSPLKERRGYRQCQYPPLRDVVFEKERKKVKIALIHRTL